MLKQTGCLLGVVALTACGLFRQKPIELPQPTEILMGNILMVNEAGKFATMRLQGAMPPNDAVLISRSTDGSQANLGISGERAGEFLALDIRNGMPKKGDPVFLYQKMSPPKPTEKTDDPDAPKETNQEPSEEKVEPEMPAKEDELPRA